MSKVRLYGNTSGYVDLQAPDVAGDVTITLPNATGPFALESYVDAAVAAIPGIGSNFVQTVKTNTYASSTTGLQNVTGLSATITPTSNTQKVLIIVQVSAAQSDTSGARLTWDITGGNAGNYIGDTGLTARTINGDRYTSSVYESWGALHSFVGVYLDSPATASPVTYQVRVGVSSGVAYVNRNGVGEMTGASSITLIEVAA